MPAMTKNSNSGALSGAELTPACWSACNCGEFRQPMAAEAATDEGADAAGAARFNWWPGFAIAAAATAGACILVSAFIVAFVLASPARAHDLMPATAEACQAEGGCVLISRDAMVQQIKRAFGAGQAACESWL